MSIARASLLVPALIAAAIAFSSEAQIVVDLPSLSIDGSYVESQVSYDEERGVYTYSYAVFAAESNQSNITGFAVDISGKEARPQIDVDLRNNIDRDEIAGGMGQLQPDTTLPIGILLDDPSDLARANAASLVAFSFFESSSEVAPGDSRSGYRIESKFPPAWRPVEIYPSGDRWDAILRQYDKGDELIFKNDYSYLTFRVHDKVLAPYDLDVASLYLGGGQSPREVNPFLQYESPVESRNSLAAGTTEYTVTLLYGATTKPETFTAELNGVDVTSLFRPTPGVVDIVPIPLDSGTSKLKLSIKGETSSGRVATDTDTLTFIVE